MDYNQNYDIFISYRRNGGEYTAKILCDNLKSMGYRVFFDVETLRSGSFNTKLYNAIDSCTDFILVLSPNALDRCVNEDDWVRREIEYALLNKKNIIPVMLRGFTFPEKLPDSMEELRYCNGIEANSEFFDAFLKKLQTFLISKQPILRRPLVGKLVPALLIFLILGIFSAGMYIRSLSEPDSNESTPLQNPETSETNPETTTLSTEPSTGPENTIETNAPTLSNPELLIEGEWATGNIKLYILDDRTAQLVLTDDLLPDGYTISETPGDRDAHWNIMLVFDRNTNDILQFGLTGDPISKELRLDGSYTQKNDYYSYYGMITWEQEGNAFIFNIPLSDIIDWSTHEVVSISLNIGTNIAQQVDHYEFWPD